MAVLPWRSMAMRPMALLVTHISAACGSLTWMAMEWIKHGKPSVLGIFSGYGFADMGDQLTVQAIGVVSVLVYTAVVTFVILKVVDVDIGLRVTFDAEIEGLDLILHDERGYDM